MVTNTKTFHFDSIESVATKINQEGGPKMDLTQTSGTWSIHKLVGSVTLKWEILPNNNVQIDTESSNSFVDKHAWEELNHLFES